MIIFDISYKMVRGGGQQVKMMTLYMHFYLCLIVLNDDRYV